MLRQCPGQVGDLQWYGESPSQHALHMHLMHINGQIWDGGRNVLPGEEASLGQLMAPEV